MGMLLLSTCVPTSSSIQRILFVIKVSLAYSFDLSAEQFAFLVKCISTIEGSAVTFNYLSSSRLVVGVKIRKVY